MPIRWYGPADPADPTYRHFERIVNLTLHGAVFAAVNSGLWFVQEHAAIPGGHLDLVDPGLGHPAPGAWHGGVERCGRRPPATMPPFPPHGSRRTLSDS